MWLSPAPVICQACWLIKKTGLAPRRKGSSGGGVSNARFHVKLVPKTENRGMAEGVQRLKKKVARLLRKKLHTITFRIFFGRVDSILTAAGKTTWVQATLPHRDNIYWQQIRLSTRLQCTNPRCEHWNLLCHRVTWAKCHGSTGFVATLKTHAIHLGPPAGLSQLQRRSFARSCSPLAHRVVIDLNLAMENIILGYCCTCVVMRVPICWTENGQLSLLPGGDSWHFVPCWAKFQLGTGGQDSRRGSELAHFVHTCSLQHPTLNILHPNLARVIAVQSAGIYIF